MTESKSTAQVSYNKITANISSLSEGKKNELNTAIEPSNADQSTVTKNSSEFQSQSSESTGSSSIEENTIVASSKSTEQDDGICADHQSIGKKKKLSWLNFELGNSSDACFDCDLDAEEIDQLFEVPTANYEELEELIAFISQLDEEEGNFETNNEGLKEETGKLVGKNAVSTEEDVEEGHDAKEKLLPEVEHSIVTSIEGLKGQMLEVSDEYNDGGDLIDSANSEKVDGNVQSSSQVTGKEEEGTADSGQQVEASHLVSNPGTEDETEVSGLEDDTMHVNRESADESRNLRLNQDKLRAGNSEGELEEIEPLIEKEEAEAEDTQEGAGPRVELQEGNNGLKVVIMAVIGGLAALAAMFCVGA